MKRQVHGPPSAVSHHRGGNEPVTHSVHRDSQGRGKPDPTPTPPPAKPPLKSVSGVGSQGAKERMAPNGLLGNHPQAAPNPADTFSVIEKQMSDVDNKDDTMELLKEADLQSPKLEAEREEALSTPERRSAHKTNKENIEVNMDDKGDTITLLKGAPTKHNTPDIQVGALINMEYMFCLSHKVFLSILNVLINLLYFFVFVGKPRIYRKAIRAIPSKTGEHYNYFTL